ncbi:MAG: hypothetical protein AAF533_25165 [Acidobacteriota bacterium]
MKRLGLVLFYLVFGFAALLRRGRPTHLRGVAARGTLDLAAGEPALPLSLFRGDEPLTATIRHGNVAHDDDAALDIRGAALCLQEPGGGERLDLPMNTGPVTFSSAWVFLRYALASGPLPWTEKPIRENGLRRFLRRERRAHAQFVPALRRAPDSYAALEYHSKLVHRLLGDDEGWVRFRLTPWSGEDSGLPDAADRAKPWDQDRRVGEDRAHDYLREEHCRRVQDGGVRHRLEVQVAREPTPDARFLDPGRSWSSEAHPWRLVGTLHLDEPLTAEETETLSFNVGRLPTGLELLPCRHLGDPGSIGYVRSSVYSWTQRVRGALRRWQALYRRLRTARRRRRREGPPYRDSQGRRRSSLWRLVFGKSLF